MPSQAFDDILKQARDLSESDKQRLIQALLSQSPTAPANGKTLGQCMEERGVIGVASGPRDLSTNPKHMEGFGEDE